MVNKIVDGIDVTINDENMSDEEIRNYIQYTKDHYLNDYKNQTLTSLKIVVNESDEVDIEYNFNLPKFERIRRITGSR